MSQDTFLRALRIGGLALLFLALAPEIGFVRAALVQLGIVLFAIGMETRTLAGKRDGVESEHPSRGYGTPIPPHPRSVGVLRVRLNPKHSFPGEA